MRATHLRSLQNEISSHLDYINSIKDTIEQRMKEKSMKRVRGYLTGVNDTLDNEWNYLNSVYNHLWTMIEEVESPDTEQSGESECPCAEE